MNLLLLLFLPVLLYAQTQPEAVSLPLADYELLLHGYIEQDSQGKRLTLEAERAGLELQRYALDTGMAFTVSSGDAVFAFSPAGMAVSAEPGVELGFPNLRNTRVNMAAPLRTNGDTLSQYGADVSVSTELITGQGDARKAGLEESRRRFIGAVQKADDHRQQAERAFCQVLKELLSLEDAILRARSAALEAAGDLEEKRAGGYGASSVVWRTAELTLRSRDRELGEAERKLDLALKEFAESCGVEKAGIPEMVPAEKLLSIDSFDPKEYAELEEALWVHGLNNLKRRGENRLFTLNGTAGYSWRSTLAAAGNGGSALDETHVSTGLGLSRGGLSLSAKVSLPIEKMGEPAITLGFQWKPSGWKIAGLDSRLRSLAAREELLAIGEAEKKFGTLVSDYERRREELLWQQGTYEEEADLYRINADEQKTWFDRGVIRERDYQDAETNYRMAQNRLLTAGIDRKLYNLELAGLFKEKNEEE
ncbi:hypothetical protein TREPR_1426 [Treponema primitia ZAS-2]|uniref:Outer membrane efflux protein n=1 Tax=Treponema primitia (strain ATCC BAA-887 / DSM 12427 / ZAS-2) TaxID=545694 RepID=F5YQ69_TREPZ|nr:hypothetical protein [Treponema primitia]AEF84226.1 hypothetical protein TREPR_1426 [Treponema primitia ZAS-2]